MPANHPPRLHHSCASWSPPPLFRYPNFISVDWVNRGDALAILEDIHTGVSDPLVKLFDNQNCLHENVFEAPVPAAGGWAQYNTGNSDIRNDEAESMMLRGPLPAGTRIHLAGHPAYLAQESALVITLKQAIPSNQFYCITRFNQDWDTAVVKGHYTKIGADGVEGKVSRMRIEVPSSATEKYYTEITKDLGWTGVFSDDKGECTDDGRCRSEPLDAPIIGLHCSGNHCDDKRLLQASRASACYSEHYVLSPFFSEEEVTVGGISLFSKEQHCGANRYVGRVICKDSNCDNMQILCFQTSSKCQIDNDAVKVVRGIDDNQDNYCDPGAIVTGMGCEQAYCGKVYIHCSPVSYIGL